MEQVFKIFDELMGTTKKSEKAAILIRNQGNRLFTSTLKWLLDPFVLTGISSKKLSKNVSYDTTPIQTWEDMMVYFENHHTGSDDDIRIVQGFIESQPEEQREYYRALVAKSLKLGVDAKSVNAVYGKNFVPNFEIQLAEKYFEKPEKVVGEFTLTEKLDGYRLATLIHDGKIEFFSRQGQLVDGLIEIEADLSQLCKEKKICNAFFDGELVAINCEKLTSAKNYKIVTTTARKKGIKTGLKYMVFDTLRYEDFIEQTCDTEYWKRRALLEKVFADNKFTHVCLLPVLYQGSDKEMITEYLNKARENSKEGIMVNLNEGMYEFKRTYNLLKVKVMQDADLRIVDVYEGTGENKGKLGGVIVEFIYQDKHYFCGCGSGFNEKERVEYWEHPELIVGKIATISYFEITKNDDDGYGLRFAIWTHRIRFDKNEISMH